MLLLGQRHFKTGCLAPVFGNPIILICQSMKGARPLVVVRRCGGTRLCRPVVQVSEWGLMALALTLRERLEHFQSLCSRMKQLICFVFGRFL